MLSAQKSVDEKSIGSVNAGASIGVDNSNDKIIAYHLVPLVLKYFGLPGDDSVYRDVQDFKKKRFHFITNYWVRANAVYLKTMSFCVSCFFLSIYLFKGLFSDFSVFTQYLFSIIASVFVYVILISLIRNWFGDFFSKKDGVANRVGASNYPSYLFLKELGVDTIKSFSSQQDKILYFLLWCDSLKLKQDLPNSGSNRNFNFKFKIQLERTREVYDMLLEGVGDNVFGDADKVENKLMVRLLELAVYLSSVIKWEIEPNGFYEDLGVFFIEEYKIKNKIIAPNVLRKTEAQLKEDSNLYLMELIGKKK